MKSFNISVRSAVTTMMLVLVLAGTAVAMEYNDQKALEGLETGHGVFLIDTSEPVKTMHYLQIIAGTFRSMSAQNVTPDFVVVYIGPSVRFLTTEPAADLAGNEETLATIAETVAGLGALGIRQEICVIATDVYKVSNDTLLPELVIVGNGFNSLIGYQNKGYGLVPIF